MKNKSAFWISLFTFIFIFSQLTAITSVATPPENFQTEIVLSGLTEPTAIEFLPDNGMLILERGGSIKLWQNGQVSTFMTLPNVNTAMGERGLTGITLDPNFATNGYFYLFYTANSPLRDRVSRFIASGNTANPTTENILWQDNVNAPFWHHGGSVLLGADNRLYISTGDGSDRINEVQLLSSYRGKILRINLDGTIPTDNPFYDGAGPNLDEIYALGFRNPFRISLDEPTGKIYIGDVGGNDQNNSHEEVNVLLGGRNYGWPICEGPEKNPSGGNCNVPNSPGTYQTPLFSYPHTNRDASVTGGFIYRNGNFPSQYEGDYFYGDYVQNWIRALDLNPITGTLNSTYNFEPSNGTSDGPYGEIVDLEQGPDGAIYYVDIGISWEGGQNEGTIRRIRYTAANQPPAITNHSANPTSGAAPLTVDFDIDASDPEGSNLMYLWDFGDGTTSSQQDPTHIYQQNGTYIARATVSDGINSTLSDPINITVGLPPVITDFSIVSPSDQPGGEITFRAGDEISFSASASDPDGVLNISDYEWRVLLIHLSHTHPEAGPINNNAGIFTIPTTGHEINNEIHFQFVLDVTDSDGLQTSYAQEIFAETVNLNFQTVPSGLTVNVDGLARITPYNNFNSLIGFEHQLEAPVQQVFNGATYEFVSWTDGGAATHTIVTPDAAHTYTAVYEQVSTPTPNYALDFDGSNDIAVGNQIAGTTGTQTIEAWVKPDNNGSSGVMISHTTDTQGWSLELNNGQPTFWVDNNNTWSFARATTALQAGNWYHVAATYNAGTARIFVNGNQEAQTGVGTIRQGDAIRIGGLSSSYPYFPGILDEIRISNTVRYSGNFTVSTTAFNTDLNTLALYHLDDTQGQTASDASGNNYHLSLGNNSNPENIDPSWVASDSPLTPPNAAPQANNDMSSTLEELAVTINVLANDTDPEQNPLNITSVTQGSNGTVVKNINNTITYTPNTDFFGVDTFSYTISDGFSFDNAAVMVHVSGVNDNPVANADNITTQENQAVVIPILANDIDVDNDDLVIESTTPGSNGTTVINGQTVIYTPDENFQGVDTFLYTISDGQGGSDTAEVVVTIQEVNDAPIANPDFVSTNEDTAILINVLNNDSDPNLDPLDVINVSVPSNGNLILHSDDTITYTPGNNFNGNATFNYTISDGRGEIATASVNISVLAVNDPPVANNQSISTPVNNSTSVTLTGNDIENSTLNYMLVTQPAYGALSGSAPNLVYTPANNFIGNDTFTFKVNDGSLDSNIATVSITVNSSYQKSSLSFDGGNDYARGVNIPLSTTFTYEAWVKRTIDSGTYETIMGDASSNYGQAMFILFIDGSSSDCGSDQFAYYQKQSGFTHCSGVNAQLNTWYHVAITREGNGTQKFFVNGLLTSTQQNTPAPTNSNGRVGIGRAGDYNGEYFPGVVDEVRISNTARYSTSFSPSTSEFTSDANTVVLYHFSEATGQTISDSSGNSYHGTRGASTSSESVDPAWSIDSPMNN